LTPDAPSTAVGRVGTARTVIGLVAVIAGMVRVAGVLLMGASAVLGVQAWWSRFSVCVGGTPPPVAGLPADRTLACYAMQDHLYDYGAADDPWVPIADAAQREGLSLIALGVGVALVSLTLGGRWFMWPLSVAGGAGLAAMWVGMGVPAWRSGLVGEPVAFDDWISASALGMLMVLVTPFLAALAWFHGGRDGRLVAAFWVVMTVVPWEFFFTLFLWPSHDTSPLSGFFRSAVIAGAATLLVAALLPPYTRSGLVPSRVRSATRSVMRTLTAE